jgi:phage tail sheath protein FI
MPEYLAPGVYIEETSFRAKTIEGVSTSTAAFVGPAVYGPDSGVPELITSFADYERMYGGLDQLTFEDIGATDNFLAHAVRAFFENGGRRLYVTRVYDAGENAQFATATITAGSPPDSIDLKARYRGSGGKLTISFTPHVGQNALVGIPRDPLNPGSQKDPAVRGLNNFDLVMIADAPGGSPPSMSPPPGSPPSGGVTLYWAEQYFENNRVTWRFHPETGTAVELTTLVPGSQVVRLVTVTVQILYPGKFPRTDVYANLTFHPAHSRSLASVFGAKLSSRSQTLTVPLVFPGPPDLNLSGPAIARIILDQPRRAEDRVRILRLINNSSTDSGENLSALATLDKDILADSDRQFTLQLATGGSDGLRPKPHSYEGEDIDPKAKTGLKTFEDVADISIVAAPGYSYASPAADYSLQTLQIMTLLIAHCQLMRYRIAVLDSVNGQSLSEVRGYRAGVDSTYAALYYPWVRLLDPITEAEINLPPAGFVAGIYARNDIERGVHKAPANEVVQLAIDFEVVLNKAQQDVLNPEGVNCFRFFEGRGYRLWGARTISSDPEWKYVNLRRYFAYLERSIEIGTQWVVFEPNGDALWGNVRRTVEDFLFNEWQSGRLLGDKPDQAYFVRCDRSTMTQNDLDNGRLICLIGVAPIRPAEFVIFRIGQWTATKAQ